MAARVSESVAPMPHRVAVRVQQRAGHSRGTRLLFALALLTFGFATIYTGLGLTRRAWPALFPGKACDFCNLIDKLVVVGPRPLTDTPANSVFNERKNLLIIGVDKRPGDIDLGPYRTDTLMIATIDPVANQVSVLSFPRDMLIDIHPQALGGQYESRINESYLTGIQAGGSFEAGANQLKYDIQKDFGINIDYWVVMDFVGVEKLITVLGGIDVVVPDELSVYDWYYSDDDVHGKYVSIPRGVQHLDGYTAVAFGRFREDSDLNRIKRQQLVMQTALRKLFTNSLLDNPLDLWDAYGSIVHTDIPQGKMPGYGLMLKDTNGSMKFYSLGDPVNGVPTMIPFTTAQEASVLKWNRENVQYWLSQVFTKAAYSTSKVEIDNGTGTDDGRAKSLARYLSYSKGLPAIQFGPDAPRQPDTTITLNTDNRRPLADDLAKWLSLPSSAIKVVKKPDPGSPDIVIVIGTNAKTPN